MWRNTRMVVLTAICASLYARDPDPVQGGADHPRRHRAAAGERAAGRVLVPVRSGGRLGCGVRQPDRRLLRRPRSGRPVRLRGNLLFGLVPYGVWAARHRRAARAARRDRAGGRCSSPWSCSPSMLCATSIGWGLGVLGFHPFTVVGSSVLVNNLVAGVGLAPLLLGLLYGRVAERASPLPATCSAPRPRRRSRRRASRWRASSSARVGGFAAGQAIAARVWRAALGRRGDGGGTLGARIRRAAVPRARRPRARAAVTRRAVGVTVRGLRCTYAGAPTPALAERRLRRARRHAHRRHGRDRRGQDDARALPHEHRARASSPARSRGRGARSAASRSPGCASASWPAGSAWCSRTSRRSSSRPT